MTYLKATLASLLLITPAAGEDLTRNYSIREASELCRYLPYSETPEQYVKGDSCGRAITEWLSSQSRQESYNSVTPEIFISDVHCAARIIRTYPFMDMTINDALNELFFSTCRDLQETGL